MCYTCLTLNDRSKIWLLKHEIMLDINAGGEKKSDNVYIPKEMY